MSIIFEYDLDVAKKNEIQRKHRNVLVQFNHYYYYQPLSLQIL